MSVVDSQRDPKVWIKVKPKAGVFLFGCKINLNFLNKQAIS